MLPTPLLVVESCFSTSTLLVACRDDDDWGNHRSLTAGPGVTDFPGTVTLALLSVLIIILQSWLSRHRRHQLRAVCRLFQVIQDLPKHHGSITSSMVSLSATAYLSIPKVWFISQLPVYPQGIPLSTTRGRARWHAYALP